MEEQSQRKQLTLTLILLIIILLLGAALRIYQLDGESLWHDELESWRQSNQSNLRDVLVYGSIPDTHPPLFQIVLFFVIRYLGDTETLLRLPSAVAGIASIYAIFWLGSSVFTRKEGLISAFLMAVLWVPIHYSQEARNYSFLILFSIVSAAFWFQLVKPAKEDPGFSNRAAIGYVISALLLCYTHYFGVLFVGLQTLGLAAFSLLEGRNATRSIGITLLVVLGYLPWVPSMLEQFSHTVRISWMDTPKITALPAFIAFSFNRLETIAIIVLVLIVYLFIKETISWWKGDERGYVALLRSNEFILGYWLVLPLALTVAISYLWTPVYTQRNLLIAVPAVYLLLARAITSLSTRSYLQALIALLFGAVPLYHMLAVMGYYRYPYKEQFREAVEFVVQGSEQYPEASVIGYERFASYFDYYFKAFGSDLRTDLVVQDETGLIEIKSLIAEDGTGYFWFMVGHRYTDPRLVYLLEDEYQVLDEVKFQGAAVWLFQHP